jgi:hypothetical protein
VNAIEEKLSRLAGMLAAMLPFETYWLKLCCEYEARVAV